jgi:folate/biopterin transporter
MTAFSPSLGKFRIYIRDKILFGNEPTPELIAILTVYFVQGILNLARLAVSFFLKDDLHLGPAEVAAMTGIASIPWTIKPLFGFLSDGMPVFGYRRRPYLILSGILGMLSWLGMATIVDNAWKVTIAILLNSLSVAMSDVIVDSTIVERARKESAGQSGSLQSLSWGAASLGGLITAYLSGLLLQHFSTQTVFAITAFFPLIISVVAWWIAEEKIVPAVSDSERSLVKEPLVKEQIKQLWSAISQKSIWLPVAFLFIWQATPTTDSAFFFFTTNELGFEPEFLGKVRLVTSLASLIGIWIYQNYLKNVSFRSLLACTTLISCALGMTTLLLVTHANRSLGIDDRWFSLGDSLFLTVCGQITWMPVLVLSARLCPKGIEATLFALLMSVWNLSGLISHELGALLTAWLGVTETNFDNLWLLVTIANTSTLLPLAFIAWLPANDSENQATEAENRRKLVPTEIIGNNGAISLDKQGYIAEIVPEFLIKPKTEIKHD